ncbi:MAG TPA: efflux RND transporter periplasmic adaptor subunit [Pirellulales bacterium]|nr:efflux RND transporter periplasmic adaptor subunit [Pirellulales bacterium]
MKHAVAGWASWASKTIAALAFVAGVAVLLLWLAGKFAPKTPSDVAEAPTVEHVAGRVETVQTVRVPLDERAVGTIRAVHETTIGSKLLARVVEVDLKAGQQVKAGDVMVRLDDADLRAKLQQAEAAVASAEAAYAQAKTDERRYGALVKSNAVSAQEYDKIATVLRSSEAELRRAREVVTEVQVTLDWATIRAPMNGTVIDKKIDVGDMVTPGQMLVTLFDPTRMQLVASVRESLAHRLSVGEDVGVHIEGLDKECVGTISEIVPEAQAASRAFEVKVTGPCPKGVYTGMFARMRIPLGEEELLAVSRRAIRHVGQLELVQVLDGDRPVRRAVRTGRVLGQKVEVLSGLKAGEKVIVPDERAAQAVQQRQARESGHD